jgi:hypothetical protein
MAGVLLMKNKINYRRNQAGQASIELAILSGLILIVFGALLTYGQRFDAQQQVKMETFRKALAKAYERNSAVTYTYKKDVRFCNLLGGFGEGQPSTVSSTANVMWVKGIPGLQYSDGDTSFAFYEINNHIIGDPQTGLDRYRKLTKDYSGSPNEVMTPVSIWLEDISRDTAYTNRNNLTEDHNYINNTQNATLRDTVRVVPYTRYDKSETDVNLPPEQNTPDYVYQGQSYTYDGQNDIIATYGEVRQGARYNATTNRIEYGDGNAGNVIHYNKTWSTAQ